MNRRDWLKKFGGAGILFAASPSLVSCQNGDVKREVAKQTVKATNPTSAKIAFIKTSNRAEGVKRGIALLNFKDEFKDKNLFIKPNYNSAHEVPGSTHNDVLRATMDELRELNAGEFTIGDRSGMGDTHAVMREKDIFAIAKDANAKTVVFDDLKEEDWKAFQYKNSFWEKGFAVPKAVLAADSVVNLCCLKTHQYGGHFTLSLKNSVGIAAKRVTAGGYNFMRELHSSPNQRRMIAEINAAYKPSLVVLDGVESFTDGGPHKGKKVKSEVILVGTDRIAIDAVGVAILRHFGTTSAVKKGKVFEQQQIAQAVELGLGISSADQIEFLTDDTESTIFAGEIKRQFV